MKFNKSAALAIFFVGTLFGLLLLPVLTLLFECLINSFMQEPDTDEDEGLGRDEVDEDCEEEKKER